MATDALTGFHDQLLAECRDMMEKRLAKVTADAMSTALAKVMARPLPAPQVSVAAPHVAVSPTPIQVNIPASEQDLVVQVDMAPVAAALAASNEEIQRLLTQILAVLSTPVTTTVHREGPLIASTTQTRG